MEAILRYDFLYIDKTQYLLWSVIKALVFYTRLKVKFAINY
jgi:hypothetical protein